MGREDWGQVGWVGVVGWVVTSPQVTLPPLAGGWMGGNVTSGNVTSSSASAAALSAAASAVGFPNNLFFLIQRGFSPPPQIGNRLPLLSGDDPSSNFLIEFDGGRWECLVGCALKWCGG